MLPDVLSAFGLQADECAIAPFGAGLINNTWKITRADSSYILQRINRQVFQQPELIVENTNRLADYLDLHSPAYLFIRPLPARDGRSLVYSKAHGYFRMTPFVPGSHTHTVAEDPALAYETARQFGKFTKLLTGFPIEQLHVTLPDFHNLSLRQAQFETALIEGNQARVAAARELIHTIRPFRAIPEQFERIRSHPGFALRVTHHDTKISNVLVDAAGKGLCVIDLDTVMPGYFISDLGDMMRTCLSPVSEEETAFSRITIREDFFEAIVRGYLDEMKEALSAAELDHIVYAGKFMIYMQAIRFLTDHLNDDRYYGAKYEGHNFVRAGNQVALLQRLAEKEKMLNAIIKKP